MSTILIDSKKKLLISLAVMFVYIILTYCTRFFSYGYRQIRITTSYYGLTYVYPFLLFPLSLAHALSDLIVMGTMSIDVIGGFLISLLTGYVHILLRKHKLSPWYALLSIIFIPGLIVPIWLSGMVRKTYASTALSLCLGQIIPAVIGVLLIKAHMPAKKSNAARSE